MLFKSLNQINSSSSLSTSSNSSEFLANFENGQNIQQFEFSSDSNCNTSRHYNNVIFTRPQISI
ncbi:hypothetical protein DDB_G0275231 [Dictyostelium discoideum AX4]|uniref:Uncharacterized protein n=1 Tax=Dictyostelium discoideum TaxID=44689 RepID=Q86I04_DICDI|nr:hypothetical protein DDB_G0275231 [Dictyostelium discoideum AX4]EAL69896.1 hypothetical protein DDB_G0275231 [Dictyostelium discoideum AX4]|eukprot:XP_643712.1 hypothetical protein DDB_G0275231 [Dictyostelium discoideum AX4]